MKTPHCGKFCREDYKGRFRHHHPGRNRRGRYRSAASPLANDRRDYVADGIPREWSDKMARGSVRAAERAFISKYLGRGL